MWNENGHGTMLVNIAAGTLNERTDFCGVASGAELMVVKMASEKHYNKQIFSITECEVCYTESNILLGSSRGFISGGEVIPDAAAPGYALI